MKIEKSMTGPAGGKYSLQVQPTGNPSPSNKSKFAGMRCIARKDDGSPCNAIISSYTNLPRQFCTPCYGRYARRGLTMPTAEKKRKKRGQDV